MELSSPTPKEFIFFSKKQILVFQEGSCKAHKKQKVLPTFQDDC